MSPHGCGTLDVKNMDTTRKASEDVQLVEGVTKKTQTTWRKIVPIKPNPETAKRIIVHAIHIKEKKKS